MITPFLVLTPDASLGSLITKKLDAKRFEILVTADFSEAIHFVRRVNCSIAILDAVLDDMESSVSDIGHALRQINPAIEFIVVAPDGREPKLDDLAPLAVLARPVLIADVEAVLAKHKTVSSKTKSSPKVVVEVKNPERDMAETANLLWLKDVSRAAQHLTQLTLESSAQAALITRENELWAYAGQLSREAAQELGQSIQRYWDKQSDSDLLRFVRLESTEAQHMLYARKLSDSMILALVFDAETPFSKIRTQAGKLVRTLAESPRHEEFYTPPAAESQALPQAGKIPLSFEANTADDETPSGLPPISELLGDIPAPNPVRQPVAPKVALPWEQPKGIVPQPGNGAVSVAPPTPEKPRRPPASFHHETSPIVPPSSQGQGNAVSEMEETRLSSFSRTTSEVHQNELQLDLQETRRQDFVKDDEQAYIETRAQHVTESSAEGVHRILLEPASPSLVNLTYACLLIPRFDTHHLVGDSAERLTEWVPQLCVAFGWRLEHLAVRPEYLQWVVRVPPSTAPGYVMRIIRQQTSERLFNEFSRYKKDNPSGDFWAPGYLIMGSSQPHPQKLVRDFVKQTRQRQGLEK